MVMPDGSRAVMVPETELPPPVLWLPVLPGFAPPEPEGLVAPEFPEPDATGPLLALLVPPPVPVLPGPPLVEVVEVGFVVVFAVVFVFALEESVAALAGAVSVR